MLIRFLLVIKEQRDDKTLTGRQLKKSMARHHLPRVDDTVSVNGTRYPVTSVNHDMDCLLSLEEATEVAAACSAVDFAKLIAEPGWK
jgi:hypothetical protein